MKFSRKKEDQELKEILFRKYFSSKEHKKVVEEAARRSSEDQRVLSERYKDAVLAVRS